MDTCLYVSLKTEDAYTYVRMYVRILNVYSKLNLNLKILGYLINLRIISD